MKHFLVTRFNVRVPQWREVDKSGMAVLSTTWMEHRLKLFEQTYASVMEQTSTDFTWLVLWDAATPARFLVDKPGMTNILVVNWLADLQARLRQERGWIITSRLDNDDVILPTFMETIRAAVTKQKQFLNIPNGWWGDKPVQHNANQFISYVESTRRSVYHLPHGAAMKRHAPIKQITTERLWRTMLHERNYLNG